MKLSESHCQACLTHDFAVSNVSHPKPTIDTDEGFGVGEGFDTIR